MNEREIALLLRIGEGTLWLLASVSIAMAPNIAALAGWVEATTPHFVAQILAASAGATLALLKKSPLRGDLE